MAISSPTEDDSATATPGNSATEAHSAAGAHGADTAIRLRLAITRTARRLRQEAREGEGELTPTVAAALSTVERCGPVTPSELAGHEGVQRPTVTRILGKLEAADLVARIEDPGDRRSYRVAITREGSDFLHRLRSRKDAYLARRLAALGADDAATLARAAEILEDMLEPDSGARS